MQPTVAVPMVLRGAALPGGGLGSLPLSIPAAPLLFGANVNCQAALFDPGTTDYEPTSREEGPRLFRNPGAIPGGGGISLAVPPRRTP